MRKLSSVKGFLSRFFPVRLVLPMAALLLLSGMAAAAPTPVPLAEKIAVFPTAPFYIYIVYESLAVFWVAILGLLVIIRMKIREIERVHEMGADKDDPGAPLLQ